MASPTLSNDAKATRLAGWLHRRFLWLLLGCYALAAVWPHAGLRIRSATIVHRAGGEVHAPMLLLALLLFCAAAVIRWSEVRDLIERPSALALGLVVAWVGPALFVATIGQALSRIADPVTTAGVTVGLALVAAMPVANSSAGWSQNAGGNVALSLSLIVLSILLSPVAAPQMLKLMGFALSADATRNIEEIVQRFSGIEFILWVILPSLAGAATAWLAGPERIARLRPWIRLATLVDLLMLNYTNAALAMPQIVAQETPLTVALPAALTLAMCVLGILLAMLLARLAGLTQASRTTMLFALSMKHTGLALVLAGEVLASNHPRVILTILLATLLQHLVAAGIDRRLQCGNTRY